MRRHTLPADPAPFSAMNITPLIDVMLVLLIMMILTIPAVTHKVPVELPGMGHGALEPEKHRLNIDATGALSWDGEKLSDADLPARLAQVASGKAELHMQTHPEARYERFDQVLATVKRAGVERLGFVGNGLMRF